MRWNRRSLIAVVVSIGLFSAVGLLWRSVLASDTVPGTVSTLTGAGDLDDPAFAIDARIPLAESLALMPDGDLLLSDARLCTIRKISGPYITTVAGTPGSCGYSGDGGLATNAQLSGRAGLAVDDDGNIYIADRFNCAIRRLDAVTQIITHVAGGIDTCGGRPDDGQPASGAWLYLPRAPAIASNGDLYFADWSCRVRKISNGIITTVTGQLGLDGCRHDGDGGAASDGHLDIPEGIAFDSTGSLYIAGLGTCRIRMISSGVITTVAGTGTCAYNGDGASLETHLDEPYGLAVDSDGGLLIAEYGSCLVRRLKDGQLTTVVGLEETTGPEPTTQCGFNGDDTAGRGTMIGNAVAVATDPQGDAYFSEIPYTNGNVEGRVRRIHNVAGPIDTDADGCMDAAENAANEAFGGDRDPFDPWDFYDADGDAAIDLADTLVILGHFGHGPADDADDDRLDRHAPDPQRPWRTVADDDGIDLEDAVTNLESFGHSCA